MKAVVFHGVGDIRVDDVPAVGVEAEQPGSPRTETSAAEFSQETDEVAPEQDDEFQPGGVPSMALRWAVRSLAKAGTLGIIGVYPPQAQHFPIGEAMTKNLTIRLGNCNHRRYVAKLVELVRAGVVDPRTVITQLDEISNAIDAYRAFDDRLPGWLKVELEPAA
jgi:threonine dehydrogenase-like Zn-dependent dehydrogenase